MENKSIIEEKIVNDNGEITIIKYIKGNLLGEGHLSKCYEFINQENNESSAAKIIPKNLNYKEKRIKNEIKILKMMKHDNIIKFKTNFEDKDNIYILTEICKNKTLKDLLTKRKIITELEVQYYIIQIINALKYLNIRNIIHRDFNLSNIFITDKMKVKIGGFNNSILLNKNEEKLDLICENSKYTAPEIYDNNYSFEVDIWSLGVIIYTLLIGKTPFEDTENIKYDFDFPFNVEISNNARDLISKLLVKKIRIKDQHLMKFYHMIFLKKK